MDLEFNPFFTNNTKAQCIVQYFTHSPHLYKEILSVVPGSSFLEHTDMHRAGVGSEEGSASSVQLPNIEAVLLEGPEGHGSLSYEHHRAFMCGGQTYLTH